MYVVKRSEENPIITPNRDHYWEEFATFNMSPVRHGKNIYGLYRAISAVDNIKPQKQTSIIGIGKSKDGVHFEDREPFIKPEEKWEKYGCEDPRVTFFEGKYYIFYTALSSFPFTAESIKVAVAISKDLKKVESRHLVTPFNAKAMTLFPERIDGKIVVIFSFHTDQPPAKVCMAKLDNIEQLWDKTFWGKWIEEIDTHTVDFRRNNYDHLEIGATPIKTKKGWLLIYSHIQNYFPDPERLDRIFGIEENIKLYDEFNCSVLASVKLVDDSEYSRYGMAGGKKLRDGLIQTDTIIEKPGKQNAPSDLAIVSSFLFTPDIFDYLDEVQKNLKAGEELYY
ncbi:MAG: Glycosidase-related protein, partial [Candidatus Nomurabacteria bacterium GW2011_GWC1_37_9]